MSSIGLSTQLRDVKGIGNKFASSLEKLQIHTVKDLLYHFPTRYQDFSDIRNISEIEEGATVTIHGVITKTSITRTPRKHMYIVQAYVEDETGKAKAVWFNQKYLITTLKKGSAINISGKVSFDGKTPQFTSPEFEIISSEKTPRHTGKLIPIYPETKGVTSRLIRFVMGKVLPFIEVQEFLPQHIMKKNLFPSLQDSFHLIHSPSSLDEANSAFKRFSFQEIFLIQLTQAFERYKLSQHKAYASSYEPKDISSYLTSLPFELTTSQKEVLYEILEDIGHTHPTGRLVQGDVGSGKTVVVALASLVVADNGFQAVFMAPTEILARQHFLTFTHLFPHTNTGVALLTAHHAIAFFGDGLETELSKKDLLSYIKKGSISIVFGTHAVIQKDVSFKHLALVIVDEQHRFGVEQRSRLTKQKDILPHFISMSATPIPRTLSLTIFGDLSLSTITELPKDRKKIKTEIIPPPKQPAVYEFIRSELSAGHQCFVICPRIEASDESEKKNILFLDAVSVKEEYARLSTGEFKNYTVGMLHGQMNSEEKASVMKQFKEGSIDVLVSTSIVEVGVDVPNATTMIIEGAQLFGLAQLHQFRGRIGRGDKQSYCFLFTKTSGAQNKRLKALVSAKNGFELAEIDLSLRGPGQFLGSEQSGMPDLAMKALSNPQLISLAHKEAFDLIKKDPTLSKYPYLSTYLSLFKKSLHLE